MRKFSGQFNEEHLEKTIREIEVSNKLKLYNELMYLRKWLGLFIDNTNQIIDGYNKGFDMTGLSISKISETWRVEMLYYNKKKARIQKAIDIADKYDPFK